MIKHIYHYKYVQHISGAIECYHIFFKRQIKYKKYFFRNEDDNFLPFKGIEKKFKDYLQFVLTVFMLLLGHVISLGCQQYISIICVMKQTCLHILLLQFSQILPCMFYSLVVVVGSVWRTAVMRHTICFHCVLLQSTTTQLFGFFKLMVPCIVIQC